MGAELLARSALMTRLGSERLQTRLPMARNRRIEVFDETASVRRLPVQIQAVIFRDVVAESISDNVRAAPKGEAEERKWVGSEHPWLRCAYWRERMILIGSS
jgi:hypothetical protein